MNFVGIQRLNDFFFLIESFGSGALPGKMLLVSNKIDAYFM